MFPKTRIPVPSTEDMDALKVKVRQLTSTAKVLAQVLSKLNKEKKDKDLKEAVINADRVFDAGRKLDKALKGFKSMHSISKNDFKTKLEDLFRQAFSFLDGAELRMNKYQGADLNEARKLLFLAKTEAKDILRGVAILNNVLKASKI
jgi:hypothetical protein